MGGRKKILDVGSQRTSRSLFSQREEKTKRLLTCSGPKEDLMTVASQILKALGSIPLYEVDVNYSHGRKRARSVSPPRYRVEAAEQQANRMHQRGNKDRRTGLPNGRNDIRGMERGNLGEGGTGSGASSSPTPTPVTGSARVR